MKFIYKIILFFLLFPLISVANTGKRKHEKNKVIKKEFVVNKDAKVSLNNRYGNLNITTWDKNRVEIEVTITVKGDDLVAVENKLSNIRIAFNTNTSFVEAKTIFSETKNSWSWFKKSKNINYKVNYVVKMPKTNSVDLDNEYGNIYLDEISGKADINCNYGKITVGDLLANNNTIALEYCATSTINYMNSGRLNIDYSKLNVNTSEKLRVNADYSTIKLETTKNADFNCDYGSISVEKVENITINSDYVSIRLGTVKKNIDIDTDYGSVTVKKLSKDFETATINAQYASVRIGVAPSSVFNFTIDLQYAGFKRNNDKIVFYKSNSKSSKKYYEGKYGKGNTNAILKIRSQYGGVSIKENN